MSNDVVIELLWIPLGAGSPVPVVRWSGRLYEAWTAWRAGRAPSSLFHAALEIRADGARWAIEMAPAWQRAGFEAPVLSSERAGVVASGPVGLTVLGRSRLFRYEVRARPDGVIPDRDFAAGRPVRVTPKGTTRTGPGTGLGNELGTGPIAGGTSSAEVARRVLDLVPAVPRLTWGRDEARVGEMWNSNSVVAWLLAKSGADVAPIAPPQGGRAPGWRAGLAVAAR